MQLVSSDLVSQRYNPEMSVDPRSSNAVVDRQIHLLKLVTDKLMKAYSGYYVEWIEIDGLSASLCLQLCC